MGRKLNPRKILDLVEKAASGIDNLQEGAIGSSGFGFLFRDEKHLPKGIKFCGGGRMFHLGSMKEFAIEYEKRSKANEIVDLERFASDEERYNQDLYIIGSIKSLVPDLTFGDPDLQDSMFRIWLLVKTAEGRMFPARLYYGPTNLAVGRWDFKRTRNSKSAIGFENLVNFEPQNLSIEEKQALAEALELALMRTSVSDFLGIYKDDFGYRVMGIDEGKPFEYQVENYSDLEFLLFLKGYEIKNKKLVEKEHPKSRESEDSETEDSEIEDLEDHDIGELKYDEVLGYYEDSLYVDIDALEDESKKKKIKIKKKNQI